jgi:hypothetical protein
LALTGRAPCRSNTLRTCLASLPTTGKANTTESAAFQAVLPPLLLAARAQPAGRAARLVPLPVRTLEVCICITGHL